MSLINGELLLTKLFKYIDDNSIYLLDFERAGIEKVIKDMIAESDSAPCEESSDLKENKRSEIDYESQIANMQAERKKLEIEKTLTQIKDACEKVITEKQANLQKEKERSFWKRDLRYKFSSDSYGRFVHTPIVYYHCANCGFMSKTKPEICPSCGCEMDMSI